jgi:NAD(P)-dependent dehydrogenase (short-subunit alcohol dehydrogenase family)
MVNAGLEGFVRAAALDLPRGVRINAVAPGWVRETLVVMKMDPSAGVPAAQVAQTYVRAVEGNMTVEGSGRSHAQSVHHRRSMSRSVSE